MLAGIKSVSILTGEGEFIPKSLVVVPFPSVSLKGIIKFIKWEDSSRRGGYARSSITILFNEADDVIFYKYMNNLEEECQKYATRLIALEKKQDKKAKFIEELSSICEQLLLTLEKYRDDELNGLSSITTSKIETKKEEISNYVFKIIVCGDAEVGKSSIVLRFTDNAFKRRYLPTLGTNISEKILEIRDVTVQLILWDIAGQKKFQRMRKHFYGGSNGVILVFDLTRSNTFKTLSSTYQDIKNSLTNGEDIAGFIIGNKNDLENRQIKREDAEKLSKKLNFEYIETSALTGENVEESFLKLAETMYMIAKNQFIKGFT
jgi:small GTP-binding protein